MKLHHLQPGPGAHRPRERVGRGIAAGRGKTAGRGTKGQKSRTGASLPAWFEGGQTPIHMRIPKLRGFRNRTKVEFEVVNLTRIGALLSTGRFALADEAIRGDQSGSVPITLNPAILHDVGLVSDPDRPLKILGQGAVDRPLFIVADAFSRSAIAKIEAAGGTAQLVEPPRFRRAPTEASSPGDESSTRPKR